MEIIKKYSGLLIFTMVLMGVYFLKLKQDEANERIMKNHYETVGYVYNYSKNNSGNRVSFVFYLYGRQYSSWESSPTYGRNYMNKYYKLYVSKGSPKQNILFLDEEITDPIKIKEAGF